MITAEELHAAAREVALYDLDLPPSADLTADTVQEFISGAAFQWKDGEDAFGSMTQAQAIAYGIALGATAKGLRDNQAQANDLDDHPDAPHSYGGGRR